jgi:hypothetical protein
MVVLTPIERETLQGNIFTSLPISQMLNVSIFGNNADIYASVHLFSHACQHIMVDQSHYYCLLAANQGNYVRGLFLVKKFNCFSLYRRKINRDPLHSLVVANFLNVSRTYD